MNDELIDDVPIFNVDYDVCRMCGEDPKDCTCSKCMDSECLLHEKCARFTDSKEFRFFSFRNALNKDKDCKYFIGEMII